VHTGDWKIDEHPVDGRHFDRAAWERVGKEGVTLMMSDSTNVLSPGRTISESTIKESMMHKVLGHKGRIITTQFASNIHRLYGVKAAADASGRKIAFVGMSLTTYLEAAKKSGLAPIDPESLVPAEEIDNVNPSELIIVTTGSQAEPRAQLAQAAFGSSRLITLHPDDLVLYSAKMIPGNEKRVMRMMNAIAMRGPEIAMRREDGLHSSGHAYRDELEEILKMLHPEHFLPVHGEYAFLKEHESLARECGVRHSTVIGNGQMMGVTPLRNGQQHGTLGNMHLLGEARLQTMFNDGGKGSGTSEDLAIEERMRIATEGIVVVDMEVFDGLLHRGSGDGGDDDGADGADGGAEGGEEGGSAPTKTKPRTRTGGFMTGRARVTSRSMWTDEGRMLAHLRDAAERAVEQLESGARLSAVERTCASAVRFACRNYCNKRPDIIVVAHRGNADPGQEKFLEQARAVGDPKADSKGEGMVGASGTRYRPRQRVRNSAPQGVRPLRSSDGPRGDGGGGNRHTRSDPSYQ
jgi:mRNA degradation ribonuclease J1/J2